MIECTICRHGFNRAKLAQIESVPTMGFVGTVLTVQKGETSLLNFKIFVDEGGVSNII